MMEVKFKGAEKAAAQLLTISKKFPGKVEGALYQEAEEIMTVSKQKHVPEDFGVLKNSGRVHLPERTAHSIRVRLTYGGAASAYAIAVHEHPSSFSPPSWQGKSVSAIRGVRTRKRWSTSGRGPKYLERPIRNAIPGMAKRIAERIMPL